TAEVALVAAYAAEVGGDHTEALEQARSVLSQAPLIGMRHECICWAWPLAARAARRLGDRPAITELVGLLESHPRGHLLPVLQAELGLVKALIASDDADQRAGETFTEALRALRAARSPYRLAQGLIDHAVHLTRAGDTEAATSALDEARAIGERLRCVPLLERAASLAPLSSAP
ncbi:MAG: hypothetical protein ACRDZ5_05490, partial [Acidimicrobiales bacterium]